MYHQHLPTILTHTTNTFQHLFTAQGRAIGASHFVLTSEKHRRGNGGLARADGLVMNLVPADFQRVRTAMAR